MPFGLSAFVALRAEQRRGSSLSFAALVLCKCVPALHHQHLVGAPPEPGVAERAGIGRKTRHPASRDEAHREAFHLVKLGDLASSAQQLGRAWQSLCCAAYQQCARIPDSDRRVVCVKISGIEATT